MRLIFIVLYLCFIVCTNTAPIDDELELVILHNNDMHARFEETNAVSGTCTTSDKENNKCYGGFARVAHLIRKYRDEESKSNGTAVLFLNAGDTYIGTTWFTVFQANITVAFMNDLKPDAISLGNHEFDEGINGLLPFLDAAEFPVLASNLDLRKVPELAAAKSLMSSTVLEKKGHKIGVIGYLTPDTKFLSAVNEVEYYDEISSINAEASKLKKDGINIIIALGHSGYAMDKKIAKECPDVDLVIGGHTNTFLYNGIKPDLEDIIGPYPVVEQNNGKKVPVVQAYAYTKYLGKLHMKFNKKGDLLEWDGQPILLNGSIPQEQDVLDLLEKYRPAIEGLKSNILGKTMVNLDGLSCRIRECNFGNLIADSFIWTNAKNHNGSDGYWTDAAVAFIQGGGIRASYDAKGKQGNISQFDIDSVLPFNSSLSKITLTGKQLKSALEHSVHQYDLVLQTGEFLQMSGLHVIYNLTKEPNHRVVHVEVLCADCMIPRYSPLEENKLYKIIATSFLLSGGDGYDIFKNKGYNMPIRDSDSVMEYIQHQQLLYPAVEGRIRILQTESADTGRSSHSTIINLSFNLLICTLIYNSLNLI